MPDSTSTSTDTKTGTTTKPEKPELGKGKGEGLRGGSKAPERESDKAVNTPDQ